MNRLERIVYQAKNGLISMDKAIHTLNKDAQREDNQCLEIVDDEHDYAAEDPLEILVQEETAQEQWEIIKKIFSKLSTLERQLIWYTVAERRSIRYAARLCGIPKSTAYDILLATWTKIIPDTISEKSCILREGIFYRRISLKKPNKLHMGYPSDLLRAVNIGGIWRDHSGKKVYRSRSRCRLAHYFKDSFGDALTVCPFCIRCREAILNDE